MCYYSTIVQNISKVSPVEAAYESQILRKYRCIVHSIPDPSYYDATNLSLQNKSDKRQYGAFHVTNFVHYDVPALPQFSA